jgi:hypothetical protein
VRTVEQHGGAGQVAHAVDVAGPQHIELGQVAQGLGLAERRTGGAVHAQQFLGQLGALLETAHVEVGVHLALHQEGNGLAITAQSGQRQVRVGGLDRLVPAARVRQPVHAQGVQMQRTERGDRDR